MARTADGETSASVFEDLLRLHTERWQERGLLEVLADERIPAWHGEALPLLSRSGTLHLGTLILNGEILGVLYSLVDPPSRRERRQYFYITAYSTEHADLRPGTLLLAFAMDRTAREGVQVIDMLRREETYKKIWRLEQTPTYGVALRKHAEIRAKAAVASVAA